jgi:hypothetical protein
VGQRVGGRLELGRIELGEHPLPVVALAIVCGHRAGSAAYPIGTAGLDQAIDLLAPAEACDAWKHVNLNAWRWLRAGLDEPDEVVAAFTGALDEPSDDPHVAALRAAVWSGRKENPDGTTTLWRPVGPEELRLVEASDWREFPHRLPDQPFFYPVLNEAYAARIAREWNAPANGAGDVTRFRVDTAFARRYPSRGAGGTGIDELWVPAGDLAEFCRHLVGPIEVTASFRATAR